MPMSRTRPALAETTTRPAGARAPDAGLCAWAGCSAPGQYRAPKDRTLSEYVFFCLEHVRQYNATWDFHLHMSPAEIEAEIRRMVTWDRPTWPLGQTGAKHAWGWTPQGLHDPLGLGAGTAFDPARRKRARTASWAEARGFKAEERRALGVLAIDGPVTLAELKRRYKALVKQHHPDAHGGSAEAEARMKIINHAYQVLCAALRRITSA